MAGIPWPHKVMRGCQTKHRYPSQGRADAGARSLRRLEEREGIEPTGALASYFCPRCKGWHIGHSDRRTV